MTSSLPVHSLPDRRYRSTGQPISVADLQTERQRWPQFAAAATKAGFVSVHAVPVRVSGATLGALGLFGTSVGQLDAADLLVGQTLAHVACVAILQANAPTLEAVTAPLRAALLSRIVVDQAVGFLYEHLDLPMSDAFRLLRRCARQRHEHLTDVARELVTNPDTGPVILAEVATMASGNP